MRKAQMLEAIFVAGSIFVGMTGSFWARIDSHITQSMLRIGFTVSVPNGTVPSVLDMMVARSTRESCRIVESLPKILMRY